MEEAKVPFLGMSLAGRILVARPDLEDPRFHATLMLLLEHGSEGALAVVINRPSKLELAGRLSRTGRTWAPLRTWCSPVVRLTVMR